MFPSYFSIIISLCQRTQSDYIYLNEFEFTISDDVLKVLLISGNEKSAGINMFAASSTSIRDTFFTITGIISIPFAPKAEDIIPGKIPEKVPRNIPNSNEDDEKITSSDIIAVLHQYLGVQRQKDINSRTELDDAALGACKRFRLLLTIAHYAARKAACNLLEEDFLAVRRGHYGAGMLVLERGLRLEREHMLSRMVLEIRHRAGHRPEIGVHVEEIHINRNLEALSVEHLALEGLLADDHLPVANRADKLVAAGALSFRHVKERGLPDAEPQQQSRKRPSQERHIQEEEHQEYGKRTEEIYHQHGTIRVTVYFQSHISENAKR